MEARQEGEASARGEATATATESKQQQTKSSQTPGEVSSNDKPEGPRGAGRWIHVIDIDDCKDMDSEW